jgi:hypothetical protein
VTFLAFGVNAAQKKLSFRRKRDQFLELSSRCSELADGINLLDSRDDKILAFIIEELDDRVNVEDYIYDEWLSKLQDMQISFETAASEYGEKVKGPQDTLALKKMRIKFIANFDSIFEEFYGVRRSISTPKSAAKLESQDYGPLHLFILELLKPVFGPYAESGLVKQIQKYKKESGAKKST